MLIRVMRQYANSIQPRQVRRPKVSVPNRMFFREEHVGQEKEVPHPQPPARYVNEVREAMMERRRVMEHVMGMPSVVKEAHEMGKGENVFNVPKSIENSLRHMGKWGGVKTVEGQRYVIAGGKVFKSVPPKVEVEGNKLMIKPQIDVWRQYAKASDEGRVAVSINIANGWGRLIVYVDKNGKVIVPPSEKGIIHIAPDGSIVVDVLRGIVDYKRGAFRGRKVKVNVSLWGKYDGVNMSVAGTDTGVQL